MLRFPRWPDWELPPRQRLHGYTGGPYIVFRDGRWLCFRSRWAARNYRQGHRFNQLYYHGATLEELRENIRRSKDYRYGYWHVRKS